MIGSDMLRGFNDLIILSLLIEGDSYGYELSKKIRERTNDVYTIKETTLYSAVTRLEKNGLITSYPGNETKGKKRTYFKLTSEGLAHLIEKEKEWEITKTIVNEFIGG